MNWKYIGFTIVIFACQAWTIRSQCQQVNSSNGVISDSYKVSGFIITQRCWKIAVAANNFIRATIELPMFFTKERRNCSNAYVEAKMINVGSKKYCGFDSIGNEILFSATNDSYLELTFYVNSRPYPNGIDFSFRLKYVIKNNDTTEAGENGINWLKRRHNPFWGWKEDTPRAVIALYLSGGAQFNGTLIEESMAKQVELRAALALTWNSVSIERLSTFINALLSICLRPQHFYGHNLVAKLRKQVELSDNFTHPAAYLALCNANETWPDRAATDLTYVLSNKLDYRFIRDFEAFAVMALSCYYNRRNASVDTEDSTLRSLYFESIKRMKEYQKHDGSFGNPHTTALFTQALIASGQEFVTDWRLNDNIKYLMKELNATSVNFLSVYTILPLLNRKTLADIAHVNCAENPRFEGEDPVSELKDNRGSKMRVQYSLYIGDQKDVIHTISLRVPENSTAYRIIQFAAIEDQKYKFKVETIDNAKHIYEIAGIPNDPEDGKFWLLYIKPRNSIPFFLHTSNPEELMLEDGDHLLMWYKSQEI